MSSRQNPPSLKTAFDYFTKAIIVGNSNVGKTSLMIRYCDNHFQHSVKQTIGVDFGIKNIKIDDHRMKLCIWDTAGQERYRSISLGFFNNVYGIMLLYAVNDRESFMEVEYWMSVIKKRAPEDACIILIGNKVDVDHIETEEERRIAPRCVSRSEGERLARVYNARFFETSAKDGVNVTEAFDALNEEIYKVVRMRQEKEGPRNSLMISGQKKREEGSCIKALKRFFSIRSRD